MAVTIKTIYFFFINLFTWLIFIKRIVGNITISNTPTNPPTKPIIAPMYLIPAIDDTVIMDKNMKLIIIYL